MLFGEMYNHGYTFRVKPLFNIPPLFIHYIWPQLNVFLALYR